MTLDERDEIDVESVRSVLLAMGAEVPVFLGPAGGCCQVEFENGGRAFYAQPPDFDRRVFFSEQYDALAWPELDDGGPDA